MSVGGQVKTKSGVKGSRISKTTGRRKNMTTYGVDYTSVVSGEPRDANLIRLDAKFDGMEEMCSASVHLTVLQRLKTDMIDSHTLGSATFKLVEGMPTIEANAKTTTLDVLKKSGDKNGTMTVRVWTTQRDEKVIPQFVVDNWRSIGVGLLLVSYGLLRRVGFLAWMVVALGAFWFCLELPLLLGQALTLILSVAVPGLNFYVEAVRIYMSFVWPPYGHVARRRCLMLHVEVDDFRLFNDPQLNYSHEEFVRASHILLRLGFDPFCIISTLMRCFRRVKVSSSDQSSEGQHRRLVMMSRGSGLAAKDKNVLDMGPGSSDPYMLLLAATREEAQAALEHFKTPDALVQICKTERVDCDLNPVWNPVALDHAIVIQKLKQGGDKVALVAVYDYDVATADDLIGVGIVDNFLELMDAADESRETTIQIAKKGKNSGEVTLSFHAAAVVDTGAPSGIAWSPFPSVHDRLRASKTFEPTRLDTVFLMLRVDDPVVSFDVSPVNDEFNINNYVRNIALGKVKAKLPKGANTPNVLKITIHKVEWHKEAVTTEDIITSRQKHKKHRISNLMMSPLKLVTKSHASATSAASVAPRTVTVQAELRGQKVHFGGSRQVNDGVATGFVASNTIDCADPSAVLRIAVKDSMGSLVGQWITTLKMIVLDPTNVHGSSSSGGSPGKKMRGLMQLRDAEFLVNPKKEAYVDLELEWVYEASGKTHEQIMRIPKPLTALEQLQQNSAETTMKLGNSHQLTQMLADFPLLFDVYSLELNRARFFLKALFQGFETDKSKKGIYIEEIDLRDKLRTKDGEDGVDLNTLLRHMVHATVFPVLKEVSVFDTTHQIFSGLFTGLFSWSGHSHMSHEVPVIQEDGGHDGHDAKKSLLRASSSPVTMTAKKK